MKNVFNGKQEKFPQSVFTIQTMVKTFIHEFTLILHFLFFSWRTVAILGGVLPNAFCTALDLSFKFLVGQNIRQITPKTFGTCKHFHKNNSRKNQNKEYLCPSCYPPTLYSPHPYCFASHFFSSFKRSCVFTWSQLGLFISTVNKESNT